MNAGQAGFSLRGRNPDVLTCISNLSNDEVFTPPELANEILDCVAAAWASNNNGANLWSDPTVRFLDPCVKSGVFLREITARLVGGLEAIYPDLKPRVDHILRNQVFGIATTGLTALLGRRSVYCSRSADGPHSVVRSFTSDEGNLWFRKSEHEWNQGRCSSCGARASEYERSAGSETYAYPFIHTSSIASRPGEAFGEPMEFDVIVGNPPYQLSDGGGSGSSAVPIYQKFIQQAQSLEPKLLCMVVPARWYSGGKGLDDFREQMLSDRRIRHLTDFPDSRDAFSGVDVAGGVCYFLWDRGYDGTCTVESFARGERSTVDRRLDEFDTFVRDNRAVSIIEKAMAKSERPLSSLVSSRKPFGLESSEQGSRSGDLYLYSSSGDARIRQNDVPKGVEFIGKWKVLLSKTASEHAGQADRLGRRKVFSRIELMPPDSVCTESYLVVGPFETDSLAANAIAYLETKFTRFLVSTVLLTQNITRGSFAYVPLEDFSVHWSDSALYSKYGLDDDEIKLIEESIRPIVRDGDNVVE